mmetsp:Transcript_13689/g.41303  ORF Transcript_13689/g.41303 Transcript_13689/m.41303 type:complete len:272 (+) Transcript_13689:470-1285(+)
MLRPAVAVVSPGGVGSSHLIVTLGERHFAVNHFADNDGLKHLHRPPKVSSLYSQLDLSRDPATKRVPFRAIYLFDQPIMAVASHFRRHFWPVQALKLNQRTCSTPDLFNKLVAKGKIRGVAPNSVVTEQERKKLYKDGFDCTAELEEYAHLGRDYYRLEESMHRWLLEDTTYDRILLHGAYQEHLMVPLLQLLSMERLPARLPVWDKQLLEPHSHRMPSLSAEAMQELVSTYNQTIKLVDSMPLLSIRYGTEAPAPDPDSDFHLQAFPGTK